MLLSKSLELGLAARAYIWGSRSRRKYKEKKGRGRARRNRVRTRMSGREGKNAGRRDRAAERVVKPRLQIYDIELEVRRTLEAGLIKFDDRELRNENETRRAPATGER